MADAPDHLDRLADLFLTGGLELPGELREGTSLRLHRPTEVEVLLIGHLPVRAGLWIAQYAHRLAVEYESVALIRLDDEHDVSIDLFGAPEVVEKLARSSRLVDAVRIASSSIRKWLIVPPGHVDPALLLDDAVDSITLLTGADEAAIVGAYTRIKGLHGAAGDSERSLPELGAVILGAPPERAGSAGERLERAAALHLGLRVPPIATIARMESLDDVYQHRLERTDEETFGQVLAWIHDESTRADEFESTEAPVESPVEEKSAPREIPLVDEPDAETRPVVETIRLRPRPIVEPFAPPKVESVEEPAQPEPVKSPRPLRAARVNSTEPAPTKREETASLRPSIERVAEPAASATPQRDRATSLAAFIKGLSPLRVPCPETSRVELATSNDGAVHLVAREGDFASIAQAESWARKNAGLLAMAFPQRLIDPAGRVVRHLVTDTPARFSDLHDSDYRLHVIAPVDVDGKRGWYSAPLNRPAR